MIRVRNSKFEAQVCWRAVSGELSCACRRLLVLGPCSCRWCSLLLSSLISFLALSLLPLPRRQPVPCALHFKVICRLLALSKRARRGVVCLQGASNRCAAQGLGIGSRWPRGRAWGCGAQKVLSRGQWWWPLGAGRSFWVADLVVLTAATTVCSLSTVGGDQEQQQRQRHHQPLVKYFKVLSLVLYFSTAPSDKRSIHT